jgi:1-phosphofructokinase family hexose kinase
VLIAGPNLTLDRILGIDELRPGEVLRFSEATVAPGGKGVNVARVCRALGFPAFLVGLAPGRTGGAVVELLRDESLELLGVPTSGEVRAASIVVERSGRVTVLNEPGPAVGDREWEAYEDAVEAHLGEHRFLVCIGSAPPGSPPDAYGRLVRLARGRGVASLVDVSGRSLAAALEAGPDLVTPNLAEAEGILLGDASQPAAERSPAVRDRAQEAAAALVSRGAGTAVVTAGAGAAVDRGSERWWVDAPRVQERNPVGAGDSMVGGLVGSLERGDDFRSALALGVAAATASVETGLPGLVDPERVRSLARRVASRGG